MNYFLNLEKDVFLEIIYKMDYKTIYDFQFIYKNNNNKIKEICNKDNFWQMKALLDFKIDKEEFNKYIGIVTSKQRYTQYLIYYLIENDKMDIFDEWSIKNFKIIGNSGLANYLVYYTIENEIKYGICMIRFKNKKIKRIYKHQPLLYDSQMISHTQIYGYHYNYMIQKLLSMEKSKQEIYKFNGNFVKASNFGEAHIYFRSTYYHNFLNENNIFNNIKIKFNLNRYNLYECCEIWKGFNSKFTDFKSYTFENIDKFLNLNPNIHILSDKNFYGICI